MPKGEYYEAEVPDTLDLAARGEMLLYGLTHFLNEQKDYAPFMHGFYNVKPAYLSTEWGEGAGCWGKIGEAMIFARLMSGSRDWLDIEQKSLEGMIKFVGIDTSDTTYIHAGMNLKGAVRARTLIGLISLQQQSPDPKLDELIRLMATLYLKEAKRADGMANIFDDPPITQSDALGVIGYGWNTFINGTVLRALGVYCGNIEPNPDIMQLSREFEKYVLQPKFWQSEASPRVFVSEDHGHFSGHHHSFCAALMGLLRQAEVQRDPRLLLFVRDGYEFLRNMGVSRIGLYGETCTTGDMAWLAVQLSRSGVGDYWEDVDGYVRNQLAETQITDVQKLRKASELTAIHKDRFSGWTKTNEIQTTRPLDPIGNSHRDVFERTRGVFLSDASAVGFIPKNTLMWTICCSGNAPNGLFQAWQNIVNYKEGTAQINLLLNRASPWVDLDSYLPYEGKAVIHNKQASSINVRIPMWVNPAEVKATVNGQPVTFGMAGRYALFNNLKPQDKLQLEFPIRETQETYTLKWKTTDFWKESTNPGDGWKADEHPNRYTLTLRGNTVVDVSPRQPGDEYQLYQRDEMRHGTAPMKKVTRFATPVRLEW